MKPDHKACCTARPTVTNNTHVTNSTISVSKMAPISNNLQIILGILYDVPSILKQIYDNANFGKILTTIL